MAQTDLLDSRTVRKSPTPPAGAQPIRVVVVGDTCVSEQAMATIVGRDKRYRVCGGAHGFYDAGELIRTHQPDVLLIEPFLQDRDGICWIKDLMMEISAHSYPDCVTAIRTDLRGARLTCRRGRLLDEERISRRTIARS
jgi:hypothetical protein